MSLDKLIEKAKRYKFSDEIIKNREQGIIDSELVNKNGTYFLKFSTKFHLFSLRSSRFVYPDFL